MRILFINPPWVRRKDNIWHDVASVMPPLGLAWMAAVLEKQAHQVRIFDAHAEHVGLDEIAARLRQWGPFDIVGITATTSLINNALHIARQAKEIMPSARVVLGGVHPTVLPEEVLGEPAVDVVVRGEGEMTIGELAAGRPLEDIPGISFRQGGAVKHNPERPLIADLDSLPLPAYHLLPMDRYHPALGAYKRLPAISMLATRGCPGRCTFCYRQFGRKLRVRSGERLAEEAKFLHDNYGIRELSFYDDTFTAVKRVVRRFCLELRRLRVDLTWSCFSRIDAVDELTLRIMKRTGCHQIMYGIESASPAILMNINKRVNLAQAKRAVRMTKNVGISVRAAFMLGNPGETIQTMEESLRFAMRLNPDLVIFNITTPFPGTEMFDWADRNGCIRTRDWEDYDLAHTVMELPTVSGEQINKFYRKAYWRFFLRPEYISMRLASMRTLGDWAQAFSGLRAVLGMTK
ncbi:MAG: cobalamin B12-binding domain-containing protein [Planctomycetes bacterium]|nr:cobalamin B12-binding domain-containing protein [Planctomycetota bacterium]